MKILITGGAGFVGSSLALAFRERDPAAGVTVLDNLRRRGSELNLDRFRRHGIDFHHGDIRQPADLHDLPGTFDVLIEASAEPSVTAGLHGSPSYVLDTNLGGTINCLEFARNRRASLVFLSTSRVYSIGPLQSIALREGGTRFEVEPAQTTRGVSGAGIDETFPTHLPRSLYGATKLASEMIIQEYVHAYGLRAVIDRCGVIAGPGQFGRADQGVFTWWVASHYLRRPLRYTGFGGRGKQVRDLLHPDDLFALLVAQIERIDSIAGEVYNVGGGADGSVSLLELTGLCRDIVGVEVPVESDPSTTAVDVPLYLSDHSKATAQFGWTPRRTPRRIVEEIAAWFRDNESLLRPMFA